MDGLRMAPLNLCKAWYTPRKIETRDAFVMLYSNAGGNVMCKASSPFFSNAPENWTLEAAAKSFVPQGRSKENFVCRLNCALYGIKLLPKELANDL